MTENDFNKMEQLLQECKRLRVPHEINTDEQGQWVICQKAGQFCWRIVDIAKVYIFRDFVIAGTKDSSILIFARDQEIIELEVKCP